MLTAALLLFANNLLLSLRLSGSGSFPKPLTAAEEREYLNRYAQGDQEARNALIEHNLRLVAHVAKKYYIQSGEQDDLISIGTIGLIKAITSFDGSKGARLATYAARCIENEILMYFRAQKKLQGEVSLADTLEPAGEDGGRSLIDVIAVDDDMLEQLDTRESCVRVRRYVNECLDDRERMVIVQRYGLDGREPRTQKEIAARCGISRSYVSRRN